MESVGDNRHSVMVTRSLCLPAVCQYDRRTAFERSFSFVVYHKVIAGSGGRHFRMRPTLYVQGFWLDCFASLVSHGTFVGAVTAL
jgi:hypothetical protein